MYQTFARFDVIILILTDTRRFKYTNAIYDDEMFEVADDDMEDEFETDSEEDDDD